MRLLIFISSLSSGGAERVAANLANHWASIGWQVTVVTLSDGTDDFYELSPSVQRFALGLLRESPNLFIGMARNLRRVVTLRWVLHQTKPSIALAMMDKANILLAIAAYGLPHIVAIGSEHIHPPQMPLCRSWASLRRSAYSHLAAVTALTTESRDWLLRNTQVRKVAVIPNAVPWPLPKQAPLLTPQEFLPSDRKMLLAVGRLNKQKGFDLLIDAFVQLAGKHPIWDLVILGEGSLRSLLVEKIKKAELENRVFLTGRVGNVGDWYKAADLYVLSSRFEGFGNSLAEALVYAVPSVSFDCDCGPRDIIRHGLDGLLVPNGDVMSLAEALDQLMSDATLRRRFSEKAIEARERFSVQKVTGMWESLFEELELGK